MKKIKKSISVSSLFHTFMKAMTAENAIVKFDALLPGKIFEKRVSLSSLLVILILSIMMFPAIVSAQAVSGITGVVTDPSGALIPGVQVLLVDTKTSREVTTTTNDNGVYTLRFSGSFRS